MDLLLLFAVLLFHSKSVFLLVEVVSTKQEHNCSNEKGNLWVLNCGVYESGSYGEERNSDETFHLHPPACGTPNAEVKGGADERT